MNMSKRLFFLGSVLLLAVAVTAVLTRPGGTSSTSSVVRSSTSPDGTPGGLRAGSRAIADPLSLHILHSYTTRQIKNEYVPSTAHGVYLVIDVAATNTTHHLVTFDGGQFSLEIDGTRYIPSTDALTALDVSGHTTFAEDDLEPSASASGWVAFDVPAGALASSPRLCLEQRTSGQTSAC
jgi:Domain of unknown function (DUF4352)